MSRREQAIAAWASYVLRFRIQPKDLIGFRYPGFEDFPVDAALMRDIGAELNRRRDAAKALSSAPLGAISGRRATVIIIDDPHKEK